MFTYGEEAATMKMPPLLLLDGDVGCGQDGSSNGGGSGCGGITVHEVVGEGAEIYGVRWRSWSTLRCLEVAFMAICSGTTFTTTALIPC